MATIKLGSNVTAIKGKLGGQVFATNKGGNYVRNNKTGGGRKSAKWSARKTTLQYVSQQWKGLTLEQMDSWNAHAATHTVKNKVGEDVYLSGFQTFVQTNIKGLNVGVAIQTSPPALPEFPYLSDLVIDFPDKFLWVPTSSLQAVAYDVTNPSRDLSATLSTPVSIENAPKVCQLSFEGERSYFLQMPLDSELPILTINGTLGFVVTLSIYKDNTGRYYARFNGGSTAFPNDMSKDVNINLAMYGNCYYIAFSINDLNDTFQNSMVGLDDELFNLSFTNTFSPGTEITKFIFHYNAVNGISKVKFNSFTFNDEMGDTDSIRLINYGYLSDNILGACSFGGPYQDSWFEDFLNDWDLFQWDWWYEINSWFKSTSNLNTLPPMVGVFKPNSGQITIDIRLYCTYPISNGRSGAISRILLLGTQEVSIAQPNYFWQKVNKLIPYVPANSNIRFFIDAYDPITGQSTKRQEIATRNKVKFKTGSEQSGTVN